MAFVLTKSFPRLWSLESGVAMIVTDLHGDWDAYRRYRDRFAYLQANNRVDCLIFTGDLIHHDDPNGPDRSVEIVLDILGLQARYGQAIIVLCGNHEMPHIYGISLAKGQREYTPAFEAALSASQRRADVMALFDSLPFYVRTRAGVLIAHAGAAAPCVKSDKMIQLFNWSHQDLLAWAEAMMTAEGVAALRAGYARLNHLPYDVMAQYYLAVSGPDDPRYNDLLRGTLASHNPAFSDLLWPALFTRCEQEYGSADYAIFLEAMLQEASLDFTPQQILVAGHMTIKGGYQLVAQRHLRLASAHHARPRETARYLLFEAAQPIREVKALLPGLESVYS